jgi:hypothetical protein
MKPCHPTAIYDEIDRDAPLDCFGASKVRRHLPCAPIKATEAYFPKRGVNERQMFAPVVDTSRVPNSILEAASPTLVVKCGVPEAAYELMVELRAVTAGKSAAGM